MKTPQEENTLLQKRIECGESPTAGAHPRVVPHAGHGHPDPVVCRRNRSESRPVARATTAHVRGGARRGCHGRRPRGTHDAMAHVCVADRTARRAHNCRNSILLFTTFYSSAFRSRRGRGRGHGHGHGHRHGEADHAAQSPRGHARPAVTVRRGLARPTPCLPPPAGSKGPARRGLARTVPGPAWKRRPARAPARQDSARSSGPGGPPPAD